ncbi:DUF167 domain-containing protein [Thermomicrobium sp. CFH 73360]|uniref:DUF167 domain-containing protein n=1 Tax=Thermomicrobium sp. CFH 73360 TaxID=2951987 RepID=UPI00207754DA|nr:DUF167 domain-containing protein [Thermomicrobium sp. CFH 73360]
MTFTSVDHPDGSVEFRVTVQPRASRSEIAGIRDDTLLVRVAAPPIDGEANAALLRTLANALDIPIRRIVIVAGEHQRRKRLRITGFTSAELLARLAQFRMQRA